MSALVTVLFLGRDTMAKAIKYLTGNFLKVLVLVHDPHGRKQTDMLLEKWLRAYMLICRQQARDVGRGRGKGKRGGRQGL